MEENERIARTVAEQRTGNANRWKEFMQEVEDAKEYCASRPELTVRDILDRGEYDRQHG